MSGDGGVGAGFPEECDGGDGCGGETHGERGVVEVIRGVEEREGYEESYEGCEQDEGREEAFCSAGDPEVPYPRAAGERKDVSGHDTGSEKLQPHVQRPAGHSGLLESHGSVEPGEDNEGVEHVRYGMREFS